MTHEVDEKTMPVLAEFDWLALAEALVEDEVVERAVIVVCERVVVAEELLLVVPVPELEGRALPEVTAMAKGSKGMVIMVV